MPPVAVSIMWFFMYDYSFGVFNYLLNQVGLPSVRWLSDPDIALYAMMAVDVWQATPFAFLLLYAAILSLPRDPYEAAAIDGAGRWHVFRTVTLPLLLPVLAVVDPAAADRRRPHLRQDLRHDARWARVVRATRRRSPSTSKRSTSTTSATPRRISFLFQIVLVIIATIYVKRVMADYSAPRDA